MKRILKLVLFGVAIGTGLVGCGDGMSPTAGAGLGGGSAGSDATLVRQADGAPPLESYTVQFTAVRGQQKEVEVKYAPPGGEPEDFLDIEIPENGLLRRPDGSTIAVGDSVDITVIIDPVEFVFTLLPAGLEFNPAEPLMIEVRYENADPDYDDDGDEDEDDEVIELEQLTMFREDGPNVWTALPTTNDTAGGILRSSSPILKNIAVSW